MPTGEVPAGTWCKGPDEVIGQAAIKGVVVDLPLTQRPYWAGRVQQAGKFVLCPPPLPQLGAVGPWSVVAPLLFSSLPGQVQRLQADCGPLLHYEISLAYPRGRIEAGDGDRLEGLMQECLCLADRLWGPIDSVLARSRSLAANRPQADWLVVLMRGFNGLEGQLQVNALGRQNRLRVALWGRRGEGVVEEEVPSLQEAGLVAQYGQWAQGMDGGKFSVWGPQQAQVGATLARWVMRSARQEREVFSGERHG